MRLADLKFTDLLISVDGRALMRGLPGARLLTPPPAEAALDITSLRTAVGANSQGRKDFNVSYDGVRYRVSRIPAQGGAWFAIRKPLLDVLKLSALGLHPLLREKIVGLWDKQGLILIAGAGGSGKTTTASSILAHYVSVSGDAAVAIEDPSEYMLEGMHGDGVCFQVEVQNRDFATPLADAMRWRPRYILLGELRDPDSMIQALRASMTGSTVIATIHSSGIQETLHSVLALAEQRKEAAGAASQMADGLLSVLHLTRSGDPARTHVQFLFNDLSTRAILRERKFEQLSTLIQQQKNSLHNQRQSG
jgi:twitching motility protein PilT